MEAKTRNNYTQLACKHHAGCRCTDKKTSGTVLTSRDVIGHFKTTTRMRMTTKLLTAFLILLFGFGQNTISESKSIVNPKTGNFEISFSDFIKKIALVELPLKTTCDQELECLHLDFSQSVINQFGPENSKIFGKLSENKNFAAIIYLYPADIVLPIIQTTDRNGKKISVLSLFDSYCGEDEFSWSTARAQVNTDLTILLSDSTITYERDSKGEIVGSTRKSVVRNRSFYINDKGEILEKK